MVKQTIPDITATLAYCCSESVCVLQGAVFGGEDVGSGWAYIVCITGCVCLHRQISKKHQMRIDTPWLDPSKTLLAQDVMVEDEVILMYRFHYHTDLER